VNHTSKTHHLFFAAVALLVSVGALTGCAADKSEAIKASTPSTAVTPRTDPEISVTCAAISSIDTAVNGAITERGTGKLTDTGYAAIVNLLPYQLKGIAQRPDAGLQHELSVLITDTTKTPSIVAGASFNPDGVPFRDDFEAIHKACDANGTPTFAIATTPAGG
jgi:hypothetical protein